MFHRSKKTGPYPGAPVLFLVASCGILGLLFGGCGGDTDGTRSDEPEATNLVPAEATASTDAQTVPTAGSTAVRDTVAAVSPPEPTSDANTSINTAADGEASPGPRERPTASDAVASTRQTGGPYSLQLGSFRSAANAENLARQLRRLGYEPTIETAEPDGVRHHRIFVRGLADQATAERLGEELRSGLGVTYLVLRNN